MSSKEVKQGQKANEQNVKSKPRTLPALFPAKVYQTEKQKQKPIQKIVILEREFEEEGCNCKKSGCLKLYCHCFALGGLCGKKCFCVECKNMVDNMQRSQAINAILEKDPFGFNIKSQKSGCNCRRSNCQKKYCYCFSQGKECGPHCYCIDCHNNENYYLKKQLTD